jgi:hypothetical protein
MLRRQFGSGFREASEILVVERLRWRLRMGVIMTLALAAIIASPLMALAGTSDGDFIVRDEPMRAERSLEPFAVIELDNGDEVSFVGIPNEGGRTEGVLVTEERSASRGSMRSVEGMSDVNPLEIFNALAEPFSSVPAILVELYGDDSTLGEQGWARDLVIVPGPTYAYCAAAGDWGDDMDTYADAFNHDNPFESTWDGPTTKPQHWGTIPGNGLGGLQNKELNGQANNVTAFYSSVLYCEEDWENAGTYNGQYIGNYVQFHFRTAGYQNWIFSQQTQLENVGDRLDHLYYPGNLFSPGAAKYDFHLTITQAKPADQFHIGATWVYGGPSDYKAAN